MYRRIQGRHRPAHPRPEAADQRERAIKIDIDVELAVALADSARSYVKPNALRELLFFELRQVRRYEHRRVRRYEGEAKHE
jgi:hypothetical protein